METSRGVGRPEGKSTSSRVGAYKETKREMNLRPKTSFLARAPESKEGKSQGENSSRACQLSREGETHRCLWSRDGEHKRGGESDACRAEW